MFISVPFGLLDGGRAGFVGAGLVVVVQGACDLAVLLRAILSVTVGTCETGGAVSEARVGANGKVEQR